jgi:uncharacterized protein YndB with AHSA1/START domain
MATASSSAPAGTHAADRTLTITRTLDAPRALAFKVWSQPEHLARWWGPRGFTLPECKVDFRAGGSFFMLMRSPEGNDHRLRGTYREIDPPARIACTWAWEDEDGKLGHETVLTVSFAEAGEKTRLTLHQAVFESLEARDSHNDGWTTCLERLAAYVAQAA